MKKNKGFTLIELLAVIVILAIISLITYPILLNVIEKTKEDSARESVNAYIHAIGIYVAQAELSEENKLEPNLTYFATKTTVVNGKTYFAMNDIIKIKGYKPTGVDDTITLNSKYEVERANLTVNGYEIKVENNKIVAIEKGKIIPLEEIQVISETTMERGSDYTIDTIFEPIYTSDQRLQYTSSDSSIVSVDNDGKVTALKNGEAIISVIPLADKQKKKEIKVTVISPSSVTGIKLNKENTVLGLGKEETIMAILEPSDATSNSLTWKSSNPDIVSVVDGKITGMSLGKATITAITQNGLEATMDVEVAYEVKFNEEVKYISTDSVSFENVDTSGMTNLVCNHNAVPSINGTTVTIDNIKNSVECNLNSSLKISIEQADISKNYILMIADEETKELVTIREMQNIELDLNGKIYEGPTSAQFILIENYGNLMIHDTVGTGKIINYYGVIKSYQYLKIDGGKYYQNRDENVSSSVVIESGSGDFANAYFYSAKVWNVVLNKQGENLTIDNCIFESVNSALINSASGILTVTNSEVISTGNIALYNFGEGTIDATNTTITSTTKMGVSNKLDGTVTLTDCRISTTLPIANEQNGTISFINTTILNETGRGIENKKTGTIIINGGRIQTKGAAILSDEAGIIKISDEKGKVHIQVTGQEYIIIGNTKETKGTIMINGHRASKNGILFDAQACTSNPDDMDAGICMYSENGYGIGNYYGDADIDGITVVTRYIALYQIRNGKTILKNAYLLNTGSTCDNSDSAVCATVRNHYSASVVQIRDSEIINEHGEAIYSASGGTTTIQNSKLSGAKYTVTVNGYSEGYTADVTLDNCTLMSGTQYTVLSTGYAKLTMNNCTVLDGKTVGVRLLEGLAYINGGTYSAQEITIEVQNAIAYLNQVNVSSSTTYDNRGPLKVFGEGTVYINGGTFEALHGGSALVNQGQVNGTIYVCGATLRGTYDMAALYPTAGSFHYSSKTTFTNGTNTPIYNANATVQANYTGTCSS